MLALVLAYVLCADAPEPAWKWSAPNPLGYVHHAGDRLLVTCEDGKLRSISLETGELHWSAELGGQRAYFGAQSDGEHVYCLTDSGRLSAFQRQTGDLLWAKEYPGKETARYTVDPETRRVCVIQADGAVTAVDGKTGTELWTVNFLAGAPVPLVSSKVGAVNAKNTEALSRPAGAVCANGRVYFSVFDSGHTFAFDLKDGSNRRIHQATGWIWPAPVAAGDDLFVSSKDSSIYCLRADTFEVRWKVTTERSINAPVAFDAGFVFVPNDAGILRKLRRQDGAEVWKTTLEPKSLYYERPIVLGKVVWIAAIDGMIHAIHTDDGKSLIQFRCQQHGRIESLNADENRIYVSTESDQGQAEDAIYAYERE